MVDGDDAVGAQLGDRGQFVIPHWLVREFAKLRNMPESHALLRMTEHCLEAKVLSEETPDEPMRARFRSRTVNLDMTVWVRREGPLLVVKRASIQNRISHGAR